MMSALAMELYVIQMRVVLILKEVTLARVTLATKGMDIIAKVI